MTITQIAFASASVPTGMVRNLNLSLGLSTTTRPVNGLSTSYSVNRGLDFTTVFSATQALIGIGSSGTFDLIFNIAPFTYNSSQGNLLLDVFINSSSGVPVFFVAGDNNPQTSRVFNLGGGGSPTANTTGLLTQFTTTNAIPEPTAMLLLGTGLAGVGALIRKKRRVQASEEA